MPFYVQFLYLIIIYVNLCKWAWTTTKNHEKNAFHETSDIALYEYAT